MATTKEILVHGIPTKVTEFDHTAQEIDDAVTAVQGAPETLGAAPAGFGYGDVSVALDAGADETEENEILTNLFNNLPVGKTIQFRKFLASPWNGMGYAACEMYNTTGGGYGGVEASIYGVHFLRKAYVAGVWRPWEWVNPPLALGVEYRTTERLYGKPVYKKMINVGYVAVGTQTYEHGIENMDIPYTLEVINVGGWCITNASGNNQYFDRTSIQFTTGANQGSVSFVMKYTKTTD